MKLATMLMFAAICFSAAVHADEKLDKQLFVLSVYGDCKKYRKLLDAGANVNARNAMGMTILMLAALHDREELVKLMLSRKADVNLKSEHGSTALNYAMNGRNSIIRMLLDAGADVDPDNHIISPLQRSALVNRPDRIDMLLRAGAKVNRENSFGESALFFAALKGHSVCTAKLIDADADCLSPMMRAVNGDEQEDMMANLLQNLFDAGVSPNLQDKSGRTVLMLAAKNKKNLCLKTLLANKADWKIKDKFGKTALDYAKEGKNTKGENLLRKCGTVVPVAKPQR